MKTRSSRPSRSAAASAPVPPFDPSPERYIARVSRASGEEVPGPIDPDELLVHHHRDNHPLEVAVSFLASRAVQITGREGAVGDGLRALNQVGSFVARSVGSVIGSETLERQAKRLMGVVDRNFHFRFREPTHLSEREVKQRVEKLQKDAAAALKKRGRQPKLHVLLTGATGFLGREILFQAASDRRIAQLVAVVRPETIRDPKTKEVLKVLTPQQRGALLLKRLHLKPAQAKKYRFVEGDIEMPDQGIAADELEALCKSLTHVVHCAASV